MSLASFSSIRDGEGAPCAQRHVVLAQHRDDDVDAVTAACRIRVLIWATIASRPRMVEVFGPKSSDNQEDVAVRARRAPGWAGCRTWWRQELLDAVDPALRELRKRAASSSISSDNLPGCRLVECMGATEPMGGSARYQNRGTDAEDVELDGFGRKGQRRRTHRLCNVVV